MLTRYSLRKNLRMVSVGLILCLALPAYGANVGACRLPTPHPRAADGVCRPKRETWGTYRTQWRPWPGDAIVLSRGAEVDAPEETDSLEGFQPPSPRDEDLQGPVISKKEKGSEDSSDDSPVDDAPAGGEAIPVLPGLDVQGQLFRSPNEGLAIPLQLPIAQNVTMLPVVEEAVATLRHIPPPSQELLDEDPFTEISDQPLPDEQGSGTLSEPMDQDPPPVLPLALRRAATQSQPRANSSIQRAAWNQPSGIRLVNPASTLVASPNTGVLKQAIYYEATDQSDDTQTR